MRLAAASKILEFYLSYQCTLYYQNIDQGLYDRRKLCQNQMPVFLGYYYKDEDNQDKVVSVARMLEFYDQISSPASLKRKVAFPEAGKHVISSNIMSKDIQGVFSETCKWVEEVLHLKPVQQ